MKTINVSITETSRNNPADESSVFNCISEDFKTIEKATEYIKDRYGRIPAGKNKIYRDRKDGTTEQVGFLHSFWNRDISHNSGSWFQTDWVCISEVDTTTAPVLIN